ncbi:site-specific integrase [Stenotrophomonas muris]|uniref:site-specific integrase n=1 Tax=Stenotrophomonas muris TaxID=2963283 RepID=UPI00405542FD
MDNLEQVLTRWLAQKEPELEHSSLIGYRHIVENILVPHCGAIALRDFDRIALKELVATFDEATSAKRINNVLGPLRGALDEAVADDLIPSNPLDGFRVKRRAKANAREEVDPFTPEEVQAILAACREDQVRNYCQFNFATGLRTSEMIGLCWSDIDWRKGTVKIRRAWVMGKMKAPKTESGVREVQLLQPAIDALKAQRAHTATAASSSSTIPEPTPAGDRIRASALANRSARCAKPACGTATRTRCATPSPPKRSAPVRT